MNRRLDPEGHDGTAGRFEVPHIHFVGEQDGASERDFKERLTEFYQNQQTVKTAYLAQVAYRGDSMIHVALCLSAQRGDERQALCESVSKIFAEMFGTHEHLDILFLSQEQETALAQVCLPFFSSAPNR